MMPERPKFVDDFFIPRIKLNTAFLKLSARNPNQAETEILMRRKEFLDDIHQVSVHTADTDLLVPVEILLNFGN